MASWKKKLFSPYLSAGFLSLCGAILSPAQARCSEGGAGIYVANFGDNTLSIIDPSTHLVSGSITTGLGPRALAYADTMGLLYIANETDNTIDIFVPRLGSPAMTVTGLSSPVALVPFSAEEFLSDWGVVVANSGNNTVTPIIVYSIEPSTTVGSNPRALAYAGSSLYVANYDSNTVNTVNVVDQFVSGTITVGAGPAALALAGTGLYVANWLDNTVNIIDIDTLSVAGTVSVGTGPAALALAGTGMYVANQTGNTVNIIDINTKSIANTIGVGAGPVALTRLGTAMYVASKDSNTVEVIDTLTQQLTTSITVGSQPEALVSVPPPGTGPGLYLGYFYYSQLNILDVHSQKISSIVPPSITSPTALLNTFLGFPTLAGTGLYLPISGNNQVAILDVTRGIADIFVPVGAGPIAAAKSGKEMYISNSQDTTISLIDIDSHAFLGTIFLGTRPAILAPAGTGMYVSCPDANAVDVIDVNTKQITHTIPVGNNPLGLARAGLNMYVANRDDNTVSIIDIDSKTVSGSVAVGIAPQFLQRAGTGIYVTNLGDNTLSVIDINTKQVANTLSFDAAPQYLTVVGTSLYVAHPMVNFLDIVDTTTQQISGSASAYAYIFGLTYVPPLGAPSAGSGPGMYVANYEDNTLSVIDVSTNEVTGLVTGLTAPRALCSFPDWERIFVANETDNSVSVVDVPSGHVIKTIPAGDHPVALASYASGFGLGELFTANSASNTVSIIDATSYLSSSVPVGNTPVALALAGTSLYVANRNDNTLNFIEIPSHVVSGTLSVGTYPSALALAGTGMYVANYGDDTVQVVDITSRGIVDTIGAGSGPIALALHGTGMCVANAVDNSISIIDTNTHLVSHTIPVGVTPYSLAIAGTGLYVANRYGDDVSLIDLNTYAVTRSLPVGVQPVALSYSPPSIASTTGEGLYVSNYFKMNKIDVVSQQVSGTITTTRDPTIAFSTSLALVENDLYVPDSAEDNLVHIYDTQTGQWTHSIPVGTRPFGLARMGTGMYVANYASNTVNIIDINSYQVSGTVAVGLGPASIATAGTGVYVSNSGDATVSVIDASSLAISHTIPVGASAWGLARAGTGMYVANYRDNTVSVIDIDSKLVSQTIPVGTGPRALALAGTGMYVAEAGAHAVSVIDIDTKLVSHTIPLNNMDPLGLIKVESWMYVAGGPVIPGLVGVIDIDSKEVINQINVGYNSVSFAYKEPPLPPPPGSGPGMYVANYADNTLSVIDTHTNTVSGIITGLTAPRALCALPEWERVFVANQMDNSVSIIDVPTGQQIKTTSVGSQPVAIASYSPYFGMDVLYIANMASNNLSHCDADGIDWGTIDVGNAPVALALAGTGMYVANRDDNTLSILDVNSASVSGPLAVGTYPSALALAGTGMYVANYGDNTVNIVDTTIQQVANTISVGTNPIALALHGTGMFVANAADNSVSVINTDTHLVSHTIPVGLSPYSLSIAGTTLYVADRDENAVSLIDLNTQAVTRSLPVGTQPIALNYTPPPPATATTGAGLYVGCYYKVNTIDITSQQVSGTVSTLKDPFNLLSYSLALAGDELYVPNSTMGNTLFVFNTQTGRWTDTITVGDGPYGLAQLGTGLYVASASSNDVSVVDLNTHQVSGTVAVGISPVAVATAGTEVYVSNSNNATVSVIDSLSLTVSHTIPVGAGPVGLARAGTGMYVSNSADNTVSIIDIDSKLVTHTIPVGTSPGGLALAGTGMYVTESESNSVSVIDIDTKLISHTISVAPILPFAVIKAGTGMYVGGADETTLVAVIDIDSKEVVNQISVGLFPLSFAYKESSTPPQPSGLLVTTTGDTNTPGTLRFALNNTNGTGGSILFSPDLTGSTIILTHNLPPLVGDLIVNPAATGPYVKISGVDQHPIFFARSGIIEINNMTLEHAAAIGGPGGEGPSALCGGNPCGGGGGGGGGAGLGGALFINSEARVTLNDVFFSNNIALGGTGGYGPKVDLTFSQAAGGGGGGGALNYANDGRGGTGGIGANSSGGGGGGGGGNSFGYAGSNAASSSIGGTGGLGGGTAGGGPGGSGAEMSVHNGGKGGSGFAPFAGGGGGGGYANLVYQGGFGGQGADFGGGGGAGSSRSLQPNVGQGGSGGFGGGGGGGGAGLTEFFTAGMGGFGAGGGGGAPPSGSIFAGGTGANPTVYDNASGGGGAGLGGAIFIRQGGSLSLSYSRGDTHPLNNNNVFGGVGGGDGALAGKAYGPDIFLSSGGELTLSPSLPIEITTSISSDQLISGLGIVVKGSGSLTLTGANTYNGGTQIIEGGHLIIAEDGNLGESSGEVSIHQGTLTFSQTMSTPRTLNVTEAILDCDTPSTVTLGGSLFGPGPLNFNGDGTFILAGDNTFFVGSMLLDTNVIQVSAQENLGGASLVFGTDQAQGVLEFLGSLSANNAFSIQSFGGTLLTSLGFTETLSGTFSGSGDLHLKGAGTVFLSGTNTGYTGRIYLDEGTLRIASGASLGSGALLFGTTAALGLLDIPSATTVTTPITVNAFGGTINNSSGATVSLASLFSGSGPLRFQGTGITTLSGNNTPYSGALLVRSGTVAISTESNLGVGTTTIGLDATHAALQFLSSSTLSRNVTLEGTGAILAFAGNWTLSGDLLSSSSAPLTIEGPGTMHFSGTNHSAGLSTLASGSTVTLAGGTFSGPITLESGATLSGQGQVGLLTSSGRVAPVTQLDVTESYTQTASGAFDVSISGDGSHDLLNIAHVATLAGTLNISASGGAFTPGQTFRILEAGDKVGGLIGSFSTVNSPSFLRIRVDYNPDPYVELVILSSSPLGSVPVHGYNPKQVEKNLEKLSYGPHSDLATVIDAMEGFDSRQLSSALDQLHPAPFGAFDLLLTNANTMITSILGRHTLHFCGDPIKKKVRKEPEKEAVWLESSFRNHPLQYLYDKIAALFFKHPAYPKCLYLPKEGEALSQETDPTNALWLEPFGSLYHQNKIGEQVGFQANTVGGVLGYEHAFPCGFSLGTGAAYDVNSLDWHEHRGHGYVHSATVALRAQYLRNLAYLETSLLGSFNRIHATRHIHFSSIDRKATHTHNNYALTAHLGGGKHIKLHSTTYLTPFANVDYFHQTQAGYTEQGADSLNLSVDRHAANLLRSELGLALSQGCSIGKNSCFIPSVWLSGVNTSFLTRKHIEAHFKGESPSFGVRTYNKPLTLLSPGIDFTFNIGSHFGLSARYNAELNSKVTLHRFDGRLQWLF